METDTAIALMLLLLTIGIFTGYQINKTAMLDAIATGEIYTINKANCSALGLSSLPQAQVLKTELTITWPNDSIQNTNNS